MRRCPESWCSVFDAFTGISIVINSCLNPYIFLFFNSDNRKASHITNNCCLNRSDRDERWEKPFLYNRRCVGSVGKCYYILYGISLPFIIIRSNLLVWWHYPWLCTFPKTGQGSMGVNTREYKCKWSWSFQTNNTRDLSVSFFRATILSVSFKRQRNSENEKMDVKEEDQFWIVSKVNMSICQRK